MKITNEENHCLMCGTQRCPGDDEAKRTCKSWNPDYKNDVEQMLNKEEW